MTTLSRAVAFGAAFGLTLFCGVAIGWYASEQVVHSVIRTRTLAIIDEQGNVDAALKGASSTDPDADNAHFVLYDRQQHSRISLLVDKDGQPRFLLRNREGIGRVHAAVWSDGKASFSLLDDTGKGRLLMYTEPDGQALVGFGNDKGRPLSTWGTVNHPDPRLLFLTDSGDVRATFPPPPGK